jgi:hypothetical protein
VTVRHGIGSLAPFLAGNDLTPDGVPRCTGQQTQIITR